MIPHRLLRRYVYSLPILLVAIATLSSGCMWGVVTDATTGAPIVGAKVTVTDGRGRNLTTTTDEQGVFSFSPTNLALLAAGPANSEVEATGYGTVTHSISLGSPFFLGTPFLWSPLDFELLRGTLVYWHDKLMHLSLLFPAGWTTAGTGEGGGIAWAPGIDDKDTFCSLSPFSQIGGSLDFTMEDLLGMIGAFGTRIRMVDTMVRGLPAVKTTVPGKFSSEDLIYMIGLNDKSACWISCQAPSSKYHEWAPKFEAIVHSLTVDKQWANPAFGLTNDCRRGLNVLATSFLGGEQ
ncbi:MAG: carboxypeptidase-like regulatory domain-containing protein [Dehalococcoidia bacterium]|jgi:hypothetical protein